MPCVQYTISFRFHDFCFQLHNVSHRKAFLGPLKTSITINPIFVTYQSFMLCIIKTHTGHSFTVVPRYCHFICNLLYMKQCIAVKLPCAYFLQDRKDALLQQSRSWFISVLTDGNTEVLRFE